MSKLKTTGVFPTRDDWETEVLRLFRSGTKKTVIHTLTGGSRPAVFAFLNSKGLAGTVRRY